MTILQVTGFPSRDRPCRGSIKPLTLARFHVGAPLAVLVLDILRGREREREQEDREDGGVGRRLAEQDGRSPEFCQWPLGHGSVVNGERQERSSTSASTRPDEIDP